MRRQRATPVMRRFTPKELPPVYKLSYHHGVFYSGMLRTAVRARRWDYFEYVKTRLDLQIDKDGNIINEENIPELDDVQPGIVLLAMYQKTQDVRYKKIVDGFIRELKEWKVNAAGGFWHKEYFPNQMWLDGLYMTGPLLCEYAQAADDAACYDLAAKQFEVMWEHTYDEASGLLLHGWDASRRGGVGGHGNRVCAGILGQKRWMGRRCAVRRIGRFAKRACKKNTVGRVFTKADGCGFKISGRYGLVVSGFGQRKPER